VPVNSPFSNCWMTSYKGCSLWRSFWATLYPQLGQGMGRLPVNTGSDASASFLRKNRTFCHPTGGSDIAQNRCFRARALV
jgi:hypothetical protein